MNNSVALVDFHLHTTCSDGAWSPERLCDEVRARQLEYFCISDHDNMDAYPVADDLRSSCIAGVEIDTVDAGNTVHVLGYSRSQLNGELLSRLDEQRKNREDRAQHIIERLNSFGIDLTLPQVQQLAQTRNSIGRPHIARALVATKHCESLQHAFDEYLAEGCKAYVAIVRLSTREAIDLIHDAGGIAIFAHPKRLREQRQVSELAKLFDGIEVLHPSADPEYRQQLFELADEQRLVTTGGTDFHARANDPAIGITLSRSRLDKFLDRVAA